MYVNLYVYIPMYFSIVFISLSPKNYQVLNELNLTDQFCKLLAIFPLKY